MDDGRLENLLGVLALALSDRVRAAAGGLNASEQAALITLRAHPDRPVAWLGAVLGLTDSGATRLADRLVSTGDVQRVPGDDARRRHLRLTYQGITHADALLASRQASLGETTSELSARDRATLERLLERLVEGLAQAPLPALRICRLCDRRACMGDSSCPLGHTTQSRDEPA